MTFDLPRRLVAEALGAALAGVVSGHLAINGLMPEDATGDALARALIARDRAALARDGREPRRPAAQPLRAAPPRTSWGWSEIPMAASSAVEAARLQEDFRRAGIEPFGWVINASLAATEAAHPVLAARAANEASEIAKVKGELSVRFAVVPMQAEDPVGADRLRGLVASEPALV